jgi:hypothetical protein
LLRIQDSEKIEELMHWFCFETQPRQIFNKEALIVFFVQLQDFFLRELEKLDEKCEYGDFSLQDEYV